MKAVVLEANEVLKYREIEDPQPGHGTVRIKVAVCGICGSDLPRVFDHGARSYPLILGHEFAGVVDKVGEGVTACAEGDHVTAAPLLPCGTCEDCRNGNYSLCGHYSFIGSRQNGAMADYVVVPEVNVVKIPDSLSMEQAATIEPSTVALHAFKVSRFTAGRSVAVIGCGIIGLYTVQWARILGASRVTAIGRGQSGLDAALRLGADRAVSTSGLSGEELRGLLGTGFDYVFECSGADETIHLAVEAAAKKGTVCLIGTPKRPLTFTVPQWEAINRKECWVTGSWMSYSAPFPGEEWTESVRCMSSGALRSDPGMVYGVYPMAQAEEAFKAIRSGAAKGRVLLKNEP